MYPVISGCLTGRRGDGCSSGIAAPAWRWNAQGAAAVCRSVGVPMLAVKTISDHADEGALLSMVRSQRQIMVNLADLLAFAFDGES